MLHFIFYYHVCSCLVSQKDSLIGQIEDIFDGIIRLSMKGIHNNCFRQFDSANFQNDRSLIVCHAPLQMSPLQCVFLFQKQAANVYDLVVYLLQQYIYLKYIYQDKKNGNRRKIKRKKVWMININLHKILCHIVENQLKRVVTISLKIEVIPCFRLQKIVYLTL